MKRLTLFLSLILSTILLTAQEYEFEITTNNPVTSVKNQAKSGTCWSYATTAFIEAELIRKGKGEHDLSEMFAVRINYLNRMKDNFLRRGEGNLGQGSLAHMYTNVVKEHGIIPQQFYNGIEYDSDVNNHTELNKYVRAISGAAVELKQMSPEYQELEKYLMDIYLGEIPEEFVYDNKKYTPESFASSLELDMDDYIEITSFTHAPFYTLLKLEVPDNWDHAGFYNVPLKEFIEIIDSALENGYTVCWDGDVSEPGFSHRDGIAINPIIDNNFKADKLFKEILPEIEVTQKLRQEGYETFKSTDDHLMLLTGIAKDSQGTKYYITKNSWGTERNKYGGYLNMSESYVRAKSISIMVNKNSVPKQILDKLGL